MLVPDGVVKRLMARAFPSHAVTIECDGGPPAVLSHFPCLEGHYHTMGSTVRLLSVAQESLLETLGRRLDKARDVNARLSRELATATQLVSP